MFQTDAGRTARTRPLSAAAWPLVIERQRLPRLGLSTLNSMAFGLAVYASQRRSPDTTQDSLPVAGQALLDGILTRKVPMKGFKVVDYISFSFPKLLGANQVALGDCSPRAPTDPYVPTLEHTVPQIMVSLHDEAWNASREPEQVGNGGARHRISANASG